MMRQNGTTVQDVFNWVFGLMGLIPYLLAVYILIKMNIDITEGILIVALAAFASHLLGLFLLRKQSDYLRELSQKTLNIADTKAIERIDLAGNLPRELFDLASSFNVMMEDMESTRSNYREATTKMLLYAKDIEGYQKKLENEAIIRSRLSRYVGHNVVEHIMNAEGDLPLQNVIREVTILFADIRSFTTLSEHMLPEEVITMLNEYFDAMANVIFEHDGVLDKFIGDELMAVFGVVGSAEDAAANAVKAALAMQEKVGLLMLTRLGQKLPVFQVGVGINTGEVVIGNVGSKNRMDYTVIGDAVNVAARFEQIAEGGMVVIGERTRMQCPSSLQVASKGGVRVRNRNEPVNCYEVIDASF